MGNALEVHPEGKEVAIAQSPREERGFSEKRHRRKAGELPPQRPRLGVPPLPCSQEISKLFAFRLPPLLALPERVEVFTGKGGVEVPAMDPELLVVASQELDVADVDGPLMRKAVQLKVELLSLSEVRFSAS